MNTVYLVGYEDGDDMCGGYHILGASTSQTVAKSMLITAVGDGEWSYMDLIIREIPLDKLGHLGYKDDEVRD